MALAIPTSYGPTPTPGPPAGAGPAPDQFRPVDPSFDAKTVVDEVSRHYDRGYQFLRPYFDRFLRFYKLYRSFSPAKTRPWRANVVVPIAFANVEHGLATMMEAYFSTPPLNKVFPREGNDYRAAMLMEAYLGWEDDDMSIFLPTHETTKELLLYGTGWHKAYWDWLQNRNQVDSVSVFNLFPDPYCETLDDAEWIDHRVLRSPGYIKRMAIAGVYEIEPAEVDRLAGAGLAYTVDGERLLQSVGLDARTARDRIEVLEEWRIDGSVVTVLNRQKLVRARRTSPFPHPYYPFLRWIDHTVPHELMGIGELEVIEKLIDEIIDMRNQRLDIVSLSINNVLVASRAAGIDADDLIMRPGQIIWANDVNQVKPLVQGGLTPLGIQEEQVARFDVQEATGNWGYNQGQVPNRREAATTVLALQRAAGLRFTAKIRWNEESALKRSAQIRMANAQQFLTDERWIRITGAPIPQRLFRDQIQGKFDFIPAASTAEPKEAKRAQVGQILPLMIQSPRIDDYELWDWILDLYNVREKEKFLLNDDEMLQRLSVRAHIMAAVQASVQQGAPALPAGAPGNGGIPGGIPAAAAGGTPIGAPGPGQVPVSLEQLSPEEQAMIRDLAARAGGVRAVRGLERVFAPPPGGGGP